MTTKEMLKAYIESHDRTSLLLKGKEGFPLYPDARMVCAALLKTELENLDRHPDFLLIKTEKAQLTVEDALSVIEKADRLPALAGRTVILVDGFDKFNVPAQNKLLKLLEEVETATVIATAYGGKILPTIKSRVQVIEYKPLSYPAYKKAVEDSGKVFDEAMYFVTGGVPCEPDEELLEIFRGVQRAVELKDRQALFNTLHLVTEKDNENFFLLYRSKVPELLAFIGRKVGTKEALKAAGEAGAECGRQSYTKEDFFLVVAKLAETM